MISTNRLPARLTMAIGGVVLNGVCVGFLRYIHMGTDPFNVLVDGLSRVTGIGYGLFYSLLLGVLLVIALVLDRRLIGVTTLANLLLVGSVAQQVENLLMGMQPAPSTAASRVILPVTLVLLCMAASFYMTPNLGVSAYDAMGINIVNRTKVPFRWLRIGSDLLCVGVGFLGGADVGIATVLTALCMGPAIELFNRVLSRPLLYGKRAAVA